MLLVMGVEEVNERFASNPAPKIKQFIKDLRAKAREVRLQWLQGDRSPPFPTGLFPPSQPSLSNILPAYFRRSIAFV